MWTRAVDRIILLGFGCFARRRRQSIAQNLTATTAHRTTGTSLRNEEAPPGNFPALTHGRRWHPLLPLSPAQVHFWSPRAGRKGAGGSGVFACCWGCVSKRQVDTYISTHDAEPQQAHTHSTCAEPSRPGARLPAAATRVSSGSTHQVGGCLSKGFDYKRLGKERDFQMTACVTYVSGLVGLHMMGVYVGVRGMFVVIKTDRARTDPTDRPTDRLHPYPPIHSRTNS